MTPLERMRSAVNSVADLLGGAGRLPELEDVAGGDDEIEAESPDWDGGWYLGARRAPAHPGRVGRAIKPWLVVVHTTDMLPGTFNALLRKRAGERGKGNGEHFALGIDPGQGLVQEVPVDRNGNHAGGPDGKHGVIVAAGRRLHPNTLSIGIEVHNAGALRLVAGEWRTGSRDDDGVWRPSGAPVPGNQVESDPARDGRGWHLPSLWQLEQLEQLLLAFGDCPVMVPPPASWMIDPNGTPQGYAPHVVIRGVPVVGHVTLDPNRKGDPHPPLSRWLRELATRTSR